MSEAGDASEPSVPSNQLREVPSRTRDLPPALSFLTNTFFLTKNIGRLSSALRININQRRGDAVSCRDNKSSSKPHPRQGDHGPHRQPSAYAGEYKNINTDGSSAQMCFTVRLPAPGGSSESRGDAQASGSVAEHPRSRTPQHRNTYNMEE
ncbi:uncharacterized protein SETTUDRAFT_26546 [Exserohilum turcica Et28A]|uniref:Uncharacterized protein n=1 Tax=Exserohilum turcicum (strain 28A) TaxID=671987 RepID=R0KN17_EXST2|nr:uncharacterized protein SETTUDRAFT_26546 [Exserohilum turcica Et28A]EOA89317.1 hypothetical protein SETTUDRAFT_26546 [Exserohilum turcica Et28A]